MKKVVLMCQQGVPFETSPARYQLVYELKQKGYESERLQRVGLWAGLLQA